jgi:hypothetical protein
VNVVLSATNHAVELDLFELDVSLDIQRLLHARWNVEASTVLGFTGGTGGLLLSLS